MTFDEILTQVLELLRREGRVSYRALKRRFDLDEDYLEDLKAEIIQAKKLAVDEDGAVLVWTGDSAIALAPGSDQERPPLSYTPAYLAEKILTSRAALEGERKQVTVLFADLKDSTELIEGLDPEEARTLLDPALHVMMDAVHRYEGTVNQVLGDGIMALFGAPVAHEDHAARACYAALAMQAAMHRYAEEVRRSHGLEMQARVGLNSGEVVVRAIGNDLHMDYSAVGQTTHLAARHGAARHPRQHPADRRHPQAGRGTRAGQRPGAVSGQGAARARGGYELVGASAIRRALAGQCGARAHPLRGTAAGAGGAAAGARAGRGGAWSDRGRRRRGGRGECVPSLPTATSASARCMPGSTDGSRPVLNWLQLSRCTVPWR